MVCGFVEGDDRREWLGRARDEKGVNPGVRVGLRKLSLAERGICGSDGLVSEHNGRSPAGETHREWEGDAVDGELNRLGTGIGSGLYGHGPTETALYVYGRKTAEVRRTLQPLFLYFDLWGDGAASK